VRTLVLGWRLRAGVVVGWWQTAVETCPVDCIHYVSYPELERLEKVISRPTSR
jgi:hypothetical protein